jgi:hypothetical protein
VTPLAGHGEVVGFVQLPPTDPPPVPLPRGPTKGTPYTSPDDVPAATNGELVRAADMAAALTAATLVFDDGATQTFTSDGRTTFTEQGRQSTGEWSVVADGAFSSFWPPDYRATYALRWIVDDDSSVGLSFTDTRSGQRFDGRYRRGEIRHLADGASE